jgi:uncharacterized integral membrane protein (TIGR00697 family)
MKNPTKQYKFFGFIVCLYVALQLVSDVTAGKITAVFGFPVSVTVLYFPITYIFADILTEVYGYARARSALWTVLICSVLAGVIYQVAALMPPASGFDADPAYKRVLGQVPRVLLGGWIAVFAGEILNDYVLAKLKIFSQGKRLWVRTIGSTIVGQFVNTSLFYVIALYAVIPTDLLIQSVISGWLLKVMVEVVMTPVTYAVVRALKRVEDVDFYDTDTNFNPLIFRPPW